jgi:tetratricopeptide (TPR) repeat protein
VGVEDVLAGRSIEEAARDPRNHRPELVRWLIQECRLRVRNDPDKAQSFGTLAQAIAQALPRHSREPSVLWTEASAVTANAFRVRGKLQEAKALLEATILRLEPEHSTQEGHRVAALVNRYRGSVYLDAGQETQARRFYGEALSTYRSLGDESGEITVLIQLAITDSEFQREAVFDSFRTVLEKARTTGHVLIAAHGIAFSLMEIGDVERASAWYRAALEHDLYPESEEPRRLWLEGLIFRAELERLTPEGNSSSEALRLAALAERAFEEALGLFEEKSARWDAHLVLLDLLRLYMRTGQGSRIVAALWAAGAVAVLQRVRGELPRLLSRAVLTMMDAYKAGTLAPSLLAEIERLIRRRNWTRL